jgi:hypothetical protein
VTYYLVVTKIALFAFIVVCNVFQLQCYSNSSAKFLAQLLLLTIPSGYLVVNSALFIYILFSKNSTIDVGPSKYWVDLMN